MSGKSVFCMKLLQNWSQATTAPMGKLIWMHGMPQSSLNDDLREMGIEDFVVVEGFRSELIRQHVCDETKFTLVLDDLNRSAFNHEYFSTLFDAIGHHNSSNIIVLSQNLYDRGKFYRHACLNTRYFVLFSSLRDVTSIDVMNRQIFPAKKGFLSGAYQTTMSAKPYSHLVVDLSPYMPQELRVRANIFDEFPVFFVHTDDAYKSNNLGDLSVFSNLT